MGNMTESGAGPAACSLEGTGTACGCGETNTRRKMGVRGLTLISAAGAAATCAICLLPLAFPAVLLAGAGGALAWLGGAHLWMTGPGVVALLAAWHWIWRRNARSRIEPAVHAPIGNAPERKST
jgi:hypothetical protein